MCRCIVQGQEGSGIKSRGPHLLHAVLVVGQPTSGSINSMPTKYPVLQIRPLKQESTWRRYTEGRMAKWDKVYLYYTHHSVGLGKANEVGMELSHDHTLKARPELVPRDNPASNRANKVIPALRVVSVEYNG